MKYILLSGNSIQNKEWIEDVKEYFEEQKMAECEIQYYKHWETGDDMIDVDHETKVLKQTIETLEKEGEEYAILAKSAGTLVTLQTVNKYDFSPKFVMFCGFPYEWAKKVGIDADKDLKDFKIKTLILQKTEDWAMHFADLETLLKRIGNDNFIAFETPGAIHHYPDIESFAYLINKNI